MSAQKRAKYGNKKAKIDGYTFDSRAEANYYIVLRQRAANREILDLTVHPSFVLVDSFTDRYGKRQRAIKHVADFSYTEKGTKVVVDVKGVQTAVWKIKHKLFLKRYPEIDYQVVQV
jgi:hypothetical protein